MSISALCFIVRVSRDFCDHLVQQDLFALQELAAAFQTSQTQEVADKRIQTPCFRFNSIESFTDSGLA